MPVSINKLITLTFIFLISCGGEPILQGFDSEKWQNDENGCKKQRMGLAAEIVDRKTELVGLNENEIAGIFGKPDRHELYSRNKKAYVYFIAGGPECVEQKDHPDKLVIRFNGVGLTKEIILYKN